MAIHQASLIQLNVCLESGILTCHPLRLPATYSACLTYRRIDATWQTHRSQDLAVCLALREAEGWFEGDIWLFWESHAKMIQVCKSGTHGEKRAVYYVIRLLNGRGHKTYPVRSTTKFPYPCSCTFSRVRASSTIIRSHW